jgi:hypothetical protein
MPQEPIKHATCQKMGAAAIRLQFFISTFIVEIIVALVFTLMWQNGMVMGEHMQQNILSK